MQSFCLDDGPGVRSCVHLQGCNLRCQWCHNPEGLSFDGGVERTADDVFLELMRDKRYFARGGGITLSGGEPLMQPDFALRILSLAKSQGVHTCIETSGSGRIEDFLRLAEHTDIFLTDYKLTDEQKHIEMTGVSNRGIIKAIHTLIDAGANLVLRCPMIPDVNDTSDHFSAIAVLSRKTLGFELMPYHALGTSKAPDQRRFTVPDEQMVEGYRQAILSQGGLEWRRGL